MEKGVNKSNSLHTKCPSVLGLTIYVKLYIELSKNKIKEVAGTATLVAPDGTSLVASVEIFSDASYLPAVGNVNGDLAFAEDTNTMHIF